MSVLIFVGIAALLGVFLMRILPGDNSTPAILLKVALITVCVALLAVPMKSFLSGREAQRAHANTLVRSAREVVWDAQDAATVTRDVAVPGLIKRAKSLPGVPRRLGKAALSVLPAIPRAKGNE